MVKLPHKGRSISRKKHNCNDYIMLDWIDACIGFWIERLTHSDIADILIEEEIYINQDFAKEYVDDLWKKLEKRILLNTGSLFYRIQNNTIIRICEWYEQIAHSFCLLLSLKPQYDTWKEEDHNIQGELFERLVEESVSTVFPYIKTFRTGWSKNNYHANYFEKILLELKKHLNLDGLNKEKWDSKNAKEYGLDILAYIDLQDKRCGLPYYLTQCASGNDWRQKLKTPDLALWKDILMPHHFALRGFAMPFCISDIDFYKASIKVEGLFMDRIRILKASEKKSNWISHELNNEIKTWIEERINRIMEED